MLRVTVYLHSAITGGTSILRTIDIINDGTGDHEIGHYDVVVKEEGQLKVLARVEDHDRGRDVLDLVKRAIEAVEP